MFPTIIRGSRQSRRRVHGDDEAATSEVSAPAGIGARRYKVQRHASADFTEADDDDDENDDFDDGGALPFGDDRDEDDDDEDAAEEDDEDNIDDNAAGPVAQRGNRGQDLPVVPLFSATHLDSLPVYSITHAIRIIVCARTETSLTWDQLRSPQVSQFLVKPMQQQIRAHHFSRGTIFALLANCLQFTKEGQRYAANAGTSNTRAKVCELLALKLLKEYSTRELIDALSYDFYPLQGLPGASSPLDNIKPGNKAKNQQAVSRTSTLEVAIRASAKHFLAHPVVVQQLEAIWNGAITFYSAADSLHREHVAASMTFANGHGTKPNLRTPLLGSLPSRDVHAVIPAGRRAVMLYDPRHASMLKLSRLRVPRYRSFLSTLSLAVLIGLFLAVLVERSVKITGLELVFWFWSAGFMLDELVGFNEQGFALYIMSFWNVFDLGILVLLIAYYCMRAYGVFLVDPHHWNDMAYDVLAANAILLLPRIFSILDHYQYFSQLLIAFRLMAVDLAAVFVIILIACSGFYVFFTLANNDSNGAEVAYKIFQILMGFTPAAWDVWGEYNWLERALMGLFLIICHFLVVTILITVLTNSFVAIASNANEEHQFLFAINTISMVKNDALFSYIAPSNIFAWLLMPLRFCIPLKHFVWLNRTIIKVTHFPVLFIIYLYERFWLAPSIYEPTDLVENPGRGRNRNTSFANPANRTALFSPNIRARDESVAGLQKDHALEEVFRRAPAGTTLRTQRRQERHKTQTAIRNWMEQNDEEGVSPGRWASADSRAVPEWQRRMSTGWDKPSTLRQVSDVRSAASDPADLASNQGNSTRRPTRFGQHLTPVVADYKDQTDADGDDELVTNDEDEDDAVTNVEPGRTKIHRVEQEDYFTTLKTARFGTLASSYGSTRKSSQPSQGQGNHQRKGLHSRTMSTNTILYRPEDLKAQTVSSASPPRAQVRSKASSRTAGTGTDSPSHATRRSSPKRSGPSEIRARPIMTPRGVTDHGGVSRSALLSIKQPNRPREMRRLSSVDLSVMSDNIPLIGDDPNAGLPGSFQTQMAMAMMKDNRMRIAGGAEQGDRDRMSRLVLARMKTLEEGFADMIQEMRDLRTTSTAPPTRRNSSGEDLRDLNHQAATRSKKTSSGDASPRKGMGKRPVSRRSIKETARGPPKVEGKGKGKGRAQESSAAQYTTDDEGKGDKGEGFTRRGGSV